MRLIDVNAGNVEQTGFFCYMSRRKSPGFQRKLEWLRARFAEGMRLKMLGKGERGFIEYLPGEYAWRPAEAEGYMFIHCLWVVGKSKGKGYGKKLLDAVVRDARKAGMKGVATLASEGNWLVGPKLLERNGFEVVDEARPRFVLMARRFGRSKPPRFTGGWEQKAKRFGKGLTVVRTDQCPYIDDAVNSARDAASERGLRFREVVLKSAREVRQRCPSAYGTFSIVLDSRLFSHHYLTRNDLDRRLDRRARGRPRLPTARSTGVPRCFPTPYRSGMLFKYRDLLDTHTASFYHPPRNPMDRSVGRLLVRCHLGRGQLPADVSTKQQNPEGVTDGQDGYRL